MLNLPKLLSIIYSIYIALYIVYQFNCHRVEVSINIQKYFSLDLSEQQLLLFSS